MRRAKKEKIVSDNKTARSETAVEVMRDSYRTLLEQVGENPDRDGLIDTPLRAAKALGFLTQGYGMDVDAVINGAMFESENDEMVIVKDIELYSMCEHHMLPFIGKCHVAYLPQGKVIGLSKLNRIVRYYAQRPQVQERMTCQIGAELQNVLGTRDVAVILDAKHLCVASRGVQDDCSETLTSFYGGCFESPEKMAELQFYLRGC